MHINQRDEIQPHPVDFGIRGTEDEGTLQFAAASVVHKVVPTF
jgi:hypothetical protein